MIELEIMLMFLTTLFFTVVYIGSRWFGWGFITFACWFILGMMWMFINPMSTGYAVALFFQIIGFIFLLISVWQVFRAFRLRKLAGTEEDDLP